MSNLPNLVNIISERVNEPYVILGTINRFDWYKNLEYWPLQILNDVRSGLAKVIINNDNEAFGINYSKTSQYDYKSEFNVINLCQHSIDALQIHSSNLLYMDSNYKLPNHLKRKGYKGVFSNIWETNFTNNEVDSLSHSILNKNIRQYKFLYLGGKPRTHRLRFYYNCNLEKEFSENTLQSTGFGYFFEGNKKITIEAKILDDEGILHNNGIDESIASTINYSFYKSTYISIIPMSFFHFSHDLFEINEKLWKPIVNLQPFIILGQPKTLNYLKNIGYKTFDKWIDESYDDILDDENRLQSIIQETKRLSKLSKSQLSDMLVDMHDVLIYNYNLNTNKRINLTVENEVYNNIVEELNVC